MMQRESYGKEEIIKGVTLSNYTRRLWQVEIDKRWQQMLFRRWLGGGEGGWGGVI
jgi:hypothetical protein